IEKLLSSTQIVRFEKISLDSLIAKYKGNQFYQWYLRAYKSDPVAVIRIGDFVSPCDSLDGDKLPNGKYLTLKSIGGFYWQGDVNSEKLVAIDGWVVANEKEYEEYKAILQDREERDHRRIGAALDLFTFDPLIGQGQPIWLESGFATKYEIEKYCYELLRRNDYHFIETPILGTTNLYKTSGHWDHYRENMFTPFKVDNEEFVLKPMNCPHEIMVYKQKPHSYRELPFRIAEFGIQHRYESSGSLTGLERVRYMKLVDTHEVLMHSQIKSEIKRIYNIILEAHKTLGTSIYSVDLSLHDPKDTKKFFDNPKMWKNAEDGLRGALKALKVPYKEMVGEAAFYGPKIDLQIKTALG
ncbi:MAG: threonine--tRNA ligase, partial [Malacoplasma sp.]|nr:threonine--tRNA ligase [Malacoplasma sp.]